MEEARIDFLSKIGRSYAKLEEEGIFSPVVAVECKYMQPTTFSDAVDIISFKVVEDAMNIFLLRHGETDWNQAGRLQGHMDIPLNQNGRLQIGHAAQILADLYPDIDLVITSPLKRARESAEIVSDRLAYEKTDIIVEPLLIERGFGEGEGLSIAERREKYPDDIYPGMESLNDMLKRARSAFERIVLSFADKENILVAAHGAILYAMVTAITDGQIEYGGETFKFDPGSLHLIRYINGTIEVAEYSEEKSEFWDWF